MEKLQTAWPTSSKSSPRNRRPASLKYGRAPFQVRAIELSLQRICLVGPNQILNRFDFRRGELRFWDLPHLDLLEVGSAHPHRSADIGMELSNRRAVRHEKSVPLVFSVESHGFYLAEQLRVVI